MTLGPRELGLGPRARTRCVSPGWRSASVPQSRREDDATGGHGGDLLVPPEDLSASHCHP